MLRPFLLSAQVSHRCYSLPLQRRISDFGSDIAFCDVNKKLKEHYGIEVPESGIRLTTLKHAEQIKQMREAELGCIESEAKACIISEMDGSMIPIVKSNEEVRDKRKNKSLFYREARLTLAHEKGTKTPIFSATLGDVNAAGRHVTHCVKAVGIDKKTKLHCVGDGAPWIANQIEEQFGANAVYLIDFYHVCDYLAAAAPCCAKQSEEKAWMEEQKRLLKDSQAKKVLIHLLPFIEPVEKQDEEAPVRSCYRYIKNRLHQMDYRAALDNDLPIGSGEIESAHRYVIQERLKIAGAWWLEENAERMLALRVTRANNHWENYWKKAA